jgi:hypothetical protein
MYEKENNFKKAKKYYKLGFNKCNEDDMKKKNEEKLKNLKN